MKNLEVIISWIVKKHKNKGTGDPKIAVGSFINDLRIMYRIKIDPQRVYKGKRKILELAVGGDHVRSFRQL